jgi:SAM-dependent methyltransferase
MMNKPANRKIPPHRAPAPYAKPATQPAPQPATQWDNPAVADWYDHLVGDAGSEYQQKVVIPGVLRMLGIDPKHETRVEKRARAATTLRVLDLACGQGVLCRRLAEEGCNVVGLDAAEALIEAARRRNDEGKLPIRYAVADATKLLDDKEQLLADLQSASFDAVTLVLAIQNMTPLSPIWQACKAALKPGGVLIVVLMHPCFRIPQQSDWIWQEKGTGSQARTIRQYLTSAKIEIQTHPGLPAQGKPSPATIHFHRPLQAYINTLGNAGLLIDHVEEWVSHKTSQAGPRKAALDRARQEIPLFLALRARRLEH